MTQKIVMELMASSVYIINKAADIIRKIWDDNDLQIIDKGTNDFQTQADRSAQHCIVSSLLHKFPNLCIIGEEDIDEKLQTHSEVVSGMDPDVLKKQCPIALNSTSIDDIVVWVDPLDATCEFTEGLLEHVTILIGISIKGKAVGGVVCQPFYRLDFKEAVLNKLERKPSVQETKPRVIWGLEGLGLFGINNRYNLGAPVLDTNARDSRLPDSNIIVSTRAVSRQLTSETIEAFCPTTVYRVGGCGFKVILLLEGIAHIFLYANLGCKRWDSCAPEALLNCAGGRLTGLNGEQYSYDKNVNPINTMGVIASPLTSWHNAYLEKIPKHIVQNLQSAYNLAVL